MKSFNSTSNSLPEFPQKVLQIPESTSSHHHRSHHSSHSHSQHHAKQSQGHSGGKLLLFFLTSKMLF